MQSSKLSQRYAKAIFDLAKERNQLSELQADFSAIRQLLFASPELESFLYDPSVPAVKQKNLLKEIFSQQANPLTMLFIEFLVERRKPEYLKDICLEFSKFYGQDQGILRVKLTSAEEMREDQVKTICQKLHDFYKKSIEPSVSVDPELLGGFVLQVNDQVYDLSIRSQFQKFRKQVLAA